MRRVLWQYIALVVLVATSIGSFIWGLSEALPETPKSAIGWFVVAYISGIVAAILFFYQQWKRAQQAEERLAARGITEARLAEARAQLQRVSEQEREALRLLLTAHHLTGPQAHTWLTGNVQLHRINQATTFLELDEQTGRWSIHQEWRTVLGELLNSAPTVVTYGWQLQVREAFVRCAAMLTALIREILEDSRRIERARQDHRGRRLPRPPHEPRDT